MPQLHPRHSHPSARLTIGSATALLAAFVLWPAHATHAASRLVPMQGVTQAIPGANGDTLDLRMSHDGTRELLLTRASNLVPGTLHGRVHMILREGDTLRRLAPGMNGAQPNGDVLAIAISGDGEYAAFTSTSSNLVSGDSGTSIDLFRLHIDSGALTRLPLGVLGALGASDSIDLNTSGSRACLSTRALLANDDTDNLHDAYLINFDPPLKTRMSAAPGGANGNRGIVGPCRFAANDAGGDTAVVFASNSFNLVSGDTNGNTDIFLRTTGSSAPLRISLAPGGVQTTGGDNSEPWLVNYDGAQTLVWRSCATNLDGANEGGCDVFMRRLDTGAIQRLSRETGGFPSSDIRASHDGRIIAFRSGPALPAPPGVQQDSRLHFAFEGANGPIVSVYARASGSERLQPAAIARHAAGNYRLGILTSAATQGRGLPRSAAVNAITGHVTPSGNSYGTQGESVRSHGTATTLRSSAPDGDVLGIAASGDGDHIAFYSLASNLSATQSVTDIGGAFVLDRSSGTVHHLSPRAPQLISSAEVGDVRAPAISADGSRVAFVASALLPQDTHLGASVYVWTRDATPALRLASVLPDGSAPIGHSAEPDMDDAGRYLVYSSTARGIVDDDFGRRDIYLHDLVQGSTVRLSESVFGGGGDGESFDPYIDAAGRVVIFCSRANDLVANDNNPGADLFSVDLDSGSLQRVEAGSGDTCHAGLSADGGVALLGGLFLDPIFAASPGGIGETEVGFRPSLDARGRFVAGIEPLGGGGDGLVRLARRATLSSEVVRIAPSYISDATLAGQQGHLDLSRDGRVLWLTSRVPLDPAHSSATRLRNLYRNLPRHLFLDSFD